MPSYLQKRRRRFYAVLEIPKTLRPHFGKPRFVRSLETDSRIVAELAEGVGHGHREHGAQRVVTLVTQGRDAVRGHDRDAPVPVAEDDGPAAKAARNQ